MSALFNFEGYERFCRSMWVKHARPEMEIPHAVLGLVGEAGEVAELFKKAIRGDGDGCVSEEKLVKELGDVLYYWTILCSLHGIDPETVALANIKKLTDRAIRGVLKGSGDDR